MDPAERHREAQRRHEAAQRAAGLKRIRLWVRPEDVAALQEAARSPHGLARLRKQALKEIKAELRDEVGERLKRETEKAMVVQARADARAHPSGSNSLPPRVRFERRPPKSIRQKARYRGWLYDPVSACWWLPDDPDRWPASEALIEEAEAAGIAVQRLASP